MTQLISLLTPRRWWEWPLGLVFWGLVASALAYGVEFAVDGQADDPFVPHVLMTSAIAAPLILMGMLMFRHLDRLQRELAHIASTDELTGLANRRAFLARVAAAGDGMLLMIDLDHFKTVNDTMGHEAGDAVLRGFAELLRTSLREDDIAGRLGGEEFAVFLAKTRPSDADLIAERLITGVPHPPGGTAPRTRVTASIGAVPQAEDDDIFDKLRLADQALYAAKNAGRARLVHYADLAVTAALPEAAAG